MVVAKNCFLCNAWLKDTVMSNLYICLGGFQEEWPASLKDFISSCLKLSYNRELPPSFDSSINQTVCLPANDIQHQPTTQNSQNKLSDSRCRKLLEEHELSNNSELYKGSVDSNSESLSDIKSEDDLNITIKSTPSTRKTDQNSVSAKHVFDVKEVTPDTYNGEISKHDDGRFTPLEPRKIPKEMRSGMSEKKLHEVCHMTSLIAMVTETTGSEVIIDVGSGLVSLIKFHSTFRFFYWNYTI